MTASSVPLTERPAWKKLLAHYEKMQDVGQR